MPIDHLQTELGRATPGILGALASIIFIRATVWRLLGFVAAGSVAAYYAGHTIGEWLNLKPELAVFLGGLFGMSIIAKIFDAIEAFQSSNLLERILTKIGL